MRKYKISNFGDIISGNVKKLKPKIKICKMHKDESKDDIW